MVFERVFSISTAASPRVWNRRKAVLHDARDIGWEFQAPVCRHKPCCSRKCEVRPIDSKAYWFFSTPLKKFKHNAKLPFWNWFRWNRKYFYGPGFRRNWTAADHECSSNTRGNTTSVRVRWTMCHLHRKRGNRSSCWQASLWAYFSSRLYLQVGFGEAKLSVLSPGSLHFVTLK